MKIFTKEELQSIFGPRAVELTTRPSHIGPAPYLIVEKDTTEEENKKSVRSSRNGNTKYFLIPLGVKTTKNTIDLSEQSNL